MAILTSLLLAGAMSAASKPNSIYDFTMQNIDGKDVPLKKFKGKVLLVVNVASYCGNTPQYKGLEELYETYKGKGFEVLGFPANEFGAQEPGTNESIKEFCEKTYSVKFPMFAKIVVKGEGINPLYDWLTSTEGFSGPIDWNFAKFVVGKDGKVVARFKARVKPESQEVKDSIEAALKVGQDRNGY